MASGGKAFCLPLAPTGAFRREPGFSAPRGAQGRQNAFPRMEQIPQRVDAPWKWSSFWREGILPSLAPQGAFPSQTQPARLTARGKAECLPSEALPMSGSLSLFLARQRHGVLGGVGTPEARCQVRQAACAGNTALCEAIPTVEKSQSSIEDFPCSKWRHRRRMLYVKTCKGPAMSSPSIIALDCLSDSPTSRSWTRSSICVVT